MEVQRIAAPKLDKSLIGFKLEKLFEYTEPDGSVVPQWCHGEVIGVKNEKTGTFKVKWNEQFIGEGEKDWSFEKLLETKWNPSKHTKGSWREYLRK